MRPSKVGRKISSQPRHRRAPPRRKLATGLDGTASAEATIDQVLEPGAEYHINVHESPSDMDTITACGELGRG